MNQIVIKQNSDNSKRLLRASSVAYSNAKKAEVKITYFVIFLAVAYPISYFLITDERFKLFLFAVSFFLTIIIQIFSDSLKGNTTKGAIIKEEFDTELFSLPWKSTLKKLDHAEISSLAYKYKGDDINDWYSPNISENIPHNTTIAIMQHSNTSWDIELRSIYRRCLLTMLSLYSCALLVLFGYYNTNAITIFLLLFSILSFYTHFISLISGHKSAIDRRSEISKHLDEIILKKQEISINELRDIQDEIYISRQESAKVPNFFFRLYKTKINLIDEDYIKFVNEAYN